MCSLCAARVAVIGPPWCERCGRVLDEPVAACEDCIPAGVDVARAPFVYDGPVSAAILGMKFGGWHALARHLGAAMAEVAPAAGIVTWVPLSRRRRSRRGFDQAELLARAVADRLGRDLRPTLARRRATGAQARRSGAERRLALAGAFRPIDAVPAEVLLVDDVFTTGATAAAAAAALREAGARRVALLTAARAMGGEVPPRCRGLASPA